MGSPSPSVKDLWSFGVDYMELKLAVSRPIRGHGQHTSEGAQHFGDVRRKEELSSLDPILGP